MTLCVSRVSHFVTVTFRDMRDLRCRSFQRSRCCSTRSSIQPLSFWIIAKIVSSSGVSFTACLQSARSTFPAARELLQTFPKLYRVTGYIMALWTPWGAF